MVYAEVALAECARPINRLYPIKRLRFRTFQFLLMHYLCYKLHTLLYRHVTRLLSDFINSILHILPLNDDSTHIGNDIEYSKKKKSNSTYIENEM